MALNAQNIEELINYISNLINQKFSELSSLVNNMQEKFSASIGQNLMQFSDLLGGKIDDIMDEISKIKIQLENIRQEKVFEMEQKAELTELIKETVTEEKTPSETKKPSIVSKPTPKVKETPPIIIKQKEIIQKPPIVKPTVSIPETTEKIPEEIPQLFDNISNSVVNNIPAGELATIMDNARNEIIRIFRWHPVLYELASFSRRIQKLPIDEPLSNDVSSLLIEKIDDWKKRILSE